LTKACSTESPISVVPSPKDHWFVAIFQRLAVEGEPSKRTSSPTATSVRLADSGTGGFLTKTSIVAAAPLPNCALPSVTSSVTGKWPSFLYSCVTVTPSALSPSPKRHTHDNGSPSGSDESEPSNLTVVQVPIESR